MLKVPNIVIDRNAERSIFSQIIEQIQTDIDSGQIPVGDSMPTTRHLAKTLGVHRNTVIRAYDELRARGYLTTHVGRNAVVQKPRASAMPPVKPKSVVWSEMISGELGQLPAVSRAYARSDTIRLSTMQPSDELVPVQEFSTCMQQVAKKYRATCLQYAPTVGIAPLRGLIVQELQEMGVEAEVDDVVVTHGASQALDLTARLLVKPGDHVLVENPTYHGGIRVLSARGAKLLPLPGDDLGPDFSGLAEQTLQQCNVCYLIPNFRNPTGTSISADRRRYIADVIKQQALVVIEDDYGFEFAFEGDLASPIKKFAADNVIYLNSFSKRLFPALRIGYALPPTGECLERLIALKATVDTGGSALMQYALVEFIESGKYRAHLDKVREIYAKRKRVMQRALEAHMPSAVHWQVPSGGLFFWIDLPEYLSVQRLVFNCLEKGLSISGGRTWSATGMQVPGVRLLFCSEDETRIKRGVEILGKLLREQINHFKPQTTRIATTIV